MGGLGRSALACRWIALLAPAASLGLALWAGVMNPGRGPWLAELDLPWVPQWGADFHLALDGVILILVLLTNFVSILAVLASWREIQERVGFFHFNLMWVTAAIAGSFMAVDLFLFYVLWEVLLVPLYFLIALWGHERRIYAAIKFFLFTQASGLLMLVGILGLYFLHHGATGVYTFDYRDLLGTPMSSAAAVWLFLAFFAAFAVKLPAVPLHTWLPDAHAQAPVAGSVILAGLVLKVGAYGMLRFAIPLFHEAAMRLSPVMMTVGVIGILYGAVLAFGQTDLKRLVAYTSISHMGFVLLGLFAWNALALQGVIVILVAHAVSTGALFILVGQIHERIGTHDMARMGGLWETAPAAGRGDAVFRARVARAAGAGQFRRGVHDAAGRLSGERPACRRRGAGAGGGGDLLAVDHPARFSRAVPGSLARPRRQCRRRQAAGRARPHAAGDVHRGRPDGGLARRGPVSQAAAEDRGTRFERPGASPARRVEAPAAARRDVGGADG